MNQSKLKHQILVCGVTGWKRHPLLRLVACLVFGLGFGLACLSTQLWLAGTHFLTAQLGTRPAGDTIILSLPGNGGRGFDENMITELSRQDFAIRVWPVTSSQFRSRTGIQLGTFRFSTELFFDAVPDDFLAHRPTDWNWEVPGTANRDQDPGKPLPELPILIPRDFLSLYNYGFAPARQLPPLSPELLALVPLEIAIDSPAGIRHLTGRIIGVTDQLATILVPQAFMDWANHDFAIPPVKGPARLLLAVRNAGDPAIARWADSHGLIISTATSGLREALEFVLLLVTAFGLLALLLLILALIVLILVRLNQLQSDKHDLQVLALLGYRLGWLAWLAVLPDLAVLSCFIFLAWWAVLRVGSSVISTLALPGFAGNPPANLLMLVLGLGLAMGVTLVQRFLCRRELH